MSDSHVERYYAGRDAWNSWANSLRVELHDSGSATTKETWLGRAEVALKGMSFDGKLNFSSFNFPSRVFFDKTCFLEEVDFSDAQFDDTVSFSGCEFFGEVRFFGTKLAQPVDFSEAIFHGPVLFSNVSFPPRTSFKGGLSKSATVFTQCNLTRSDFEEFEARYDPYDNDKAQFKRGSLGVADVYSIRFENCHLNEANFFKFQGRHAAFIKSVIYGANFSSAFLADGEFRQVHVDQLVSLENAKVNRLRIDRDALDSMRDYGGLTLGRLGRMDIRSDAAELRSEYGGYRGKIHALALTGFVFPYVWFAVEQWARARLAPDDLTGIPLWKALARFIYNGGQDWETGFSLSWSFGCFLVMLAYNVLRFGLWRKAQELEQRQFVTGLPPQFSFSETAFGLPNLSYGRLLAASKVGFWVYVAVIVVNTSLFAQIKVPTGL